MKGGWGDVNDDDFYEAFLLLVGLIGSIVSIKTWMLLVW